MVGHREVWRFDELVQPGEIYDGARSSTSFGDAEEICREAGLQRDFVDSPLL